MIAPASVIYALSLDGETHRYVGMTSRRLSARMADHRRAARDGVRRPVYDWMRKHGVENVVVTVIAGPVPPEELYALEQEAITRLRAEGYSLLNLCDGGPGVRGRKFSEEEKERLRGPKSLEQRRKQSETMRAQWAARRAAGEQVTRQFNAESRQRMSEAAKRRHERDGGPWNKGLPRTEEEKARMSAGRRGKRPSAETRAKMSAAHVGRKASPETLAKMSASAKAVAARKKAAREACDVPAT